MSAGTSLTARVDLYLAERRRLGFSSTQDSRTLRSFVNHVHAARHRGPLTAEIMADWARRDSHGSANPQTWARRLKKLRGFTRWLRQFEPRTEVPDDAIFGRLTGRLAPHIYSQQEVVDLLAAARRLGPPDSIRGAVFEALFGLVASTGMRVGEARSLRNADVDLKTGMLTIHQAKLGKARQVPLHASTVAALRRYRHARDQAGASTDADAAFFVSMRGRPIGDRQVHRVFVELRDQLLWVNRGAHHAPRIHDLRHTFVVRRIMEWQARGIDIDQSILSLSTYVGHSMVTNTYWYFSAVPELMALAARSFESFTSRAQVDHA